MSDHNTRRNFLIIQVSFCLLLFLVIPLVGCSHRYTQPASLQEDENGGVTFALWSDPHLFDGGAARRREGIEEEKLDNWSALHWAVLQTNRLVTADHRNLDFVALTGDFGLYNVEMPKSEWAKGGRNEKGLIEDDGKCTHDPKEGPGPAIPFDEAVQLVAREFRALLVKKIYLVPGNNDLCDEDPRNRYRYAAFVLALQNAMNEQQKERKDDLKRAAKSVIESQKQIKAPNPESTLPTEPPAPPEIVDLTFTMENLQPAQGAQQALQNGSKKGGTGAASVAPTPPPKKCSNAPGDIPLVKGLCLLGLDSSYFKPHDRVDVQAAADNASIDAMDRLSAQIQTGGAYLLFTHVPDIEDPFRGSASASSSWLIPAKARDVWQAALNRGELVAVFAGHFHKSDRTIYPHNFSYAKSIDPIVAQKFWLAPSLAAKYQDNPPGQESARGIVLFQVSHKIVATKAQPGDTIQGLPIWFSPLDPNPTLALEYSRQLKLGEMYERAGKSSDAESAYRKALDAATGEQRTIALQHLGSVVHTWGVYGLWMKYRLQIVLLVLLVGIVLIVWVFWRTTRRLQVYPLEAPNDLKIPAGHLEQVTEYLVGMMRYRETKAGPIGATKLPFIWSGFSKDIGTALEDLAPGKSSKVIQLFLGWLFKPEFTLRGTLANGTPDCFLILTLSGRGEPRTWEKPVPPGQAHDVLKDMVYAILRHIKDQPS